MTKRKGYFCLSSTGPRRKKSLDLMGNFLSALLLSRDNLGCLENIQWECWDMLGHAFDRKSWDPDTALLDLAQSSYGPPHSEARPL